MTSYISTHEDSPFAVALHAFAFDGFNPAELSADTRDEYRQICAMILDTPCYADDSHVRAFGDALNYVCDYCNGAITNHRHGCPVPAMIAEADYLLDIIADVTRDEDGSDWKPY